MAPATAGAADAHAHGDGNCDEFADFAHIPYPATDPYADKGADMDRDTEPATVVYRDPDGNRIVFSHGHLHFDTDSIRDLDIDADNDANGNGNLHKSADVPDRDELERKGRKM